MPFIFLFFFEGLHVLMHCLCNDLAVRNRLNNRSRAVNCVTAGEDAGARGVAVLVCNQQTTLVGLKTLGKCVLGTLADGDDYAVSLVELVRALDIGEAAVLVLDNVTEDNSLVNDFHGALVVLELHALKLCVVKLVLACCNLLCNGEAGQVLNLVAEGCSGNVHCRITCADNDNSLSKLKGLGAVQIVDAEMHVAECLALDMQGIGFPYTCADEDRLVSVTEEILDADRSSNMGVGTNLDTLHLDVTVLDVVKHRLWQTEIGNSVAENAADLVLIFKYCYLVAVSCQDNCDCDSGRTGADDGRTHTVPCHGALNHLWGVCTGNILLDCGELNRHALSTEDAMSLALLLVVANKAAHGGQWVVFKEKATRLVKLVILK